MARNYHICECAHTQAHTNKHKGTSTCAHTHTHMHKGRIAHSALIICSGMQTVVSRMLGYLIFCDIHVRADHHNPQGSHPNSVNAAGAAETGKERGKQRQQRAYILGGGGHNTSAVYEYEQSCVRRRKIVKSNVRAATMATF